MCIRMNIRTYVCVLAYAQAQYILMKIIAEVIDQKTNVTLFGRSGTSGVTEHLAYPNL